MYLRSYEADLLLTVVVFASYQNLNSYKYIQSSKTTKLILKQMAEKNKLLPNKIIKKKKIGFNSNITDWIREDRLRFFLKDLILNFLIITISY